MSAVRFDVRNGVNNMRPQQKFKIKSDRAQLVLDGYTKTILEELMSTGDFKSISQLLQIAVINLYKDYEAKGKLKPKLEKTEKKAKNLDDPENLSPDEEPIFREDVSL